MVCRAIYCERLKNVNHRLSRYYKNASFSRISPHDGRRRKIRQSRADLTFRKVSVCGCTLHYSNSTQPDGTDLRDTKSRCISGAVCPYDTAAWRFSFFHSPSPAGLAVQRCRQGSGCLLMLSLSDACCLSPPALSS